MDVTARVRRGVTIAITTLLVALLGPEPANASHSLSWSGTATTSDGNWCNLYAGVSHWGGVTATQSVSCQWAVYQVNSLSSSNTLWEETPFVRVGTTRSQSLACYDPNLPSGDDYSCYSSASISPGVTGLQYRHDVGLVIVLNHPATFDSWPAGCVVDTVRSSGRSRLTCEPTNLILAL